MHHYIHDFTITTEFLGITQSLKARVYYSIEPDHLSPVVEIAGFHIFNPRTKTWTRSTEWPLFELSITDLRTLCANLRDIYQDHIQWQEYQEP